MPNDAFRPLHLESRMQYYQECIALGSKTGLSLVSNRPAAEIDELYRELWRQIFSFERQFSRFVPSSELSVFNRASGSKQFITPEFRELLLAAQRLAKQTEGVYNPFILPALQSAGYTHSRVPGYEQDAVDDHSHKAVVGIDRLEIGDDWASIPYGTALDLGGCGKGYLADQVRDKLPEAVTGYWLSFGGDIAVGGTDEQGHPWKITVQSAADPHTHVGEITATAAGGIATSGTTVHRGKKSEKAWHHLIDPRTRQPAQTDVVHATVYDESALRADVLASCAVILGSTQGVQFLEKQGVHGALLQHRTGSGKLQTLHFGNAIMVTAAHA